ncbi:MAG: hypothetical protein ACP5MD_03765 [Verrucomicrobiia bacterium]
MAERSMNGSALGRNIVGRKIGGRKMGEQENEVGSDVWHGTRHLGCASPEIWQHDQTKTPKALFGA